MALEVDIEKRLGAFHLRAAFCCDRETLGILGASGSGKSLTLKCIAGIEKPDRGHIELDGRVLYDSKKHINLRPQSRNVGYLFQNYALFPNMTLRQNILCGMRAVKGREEKERRLREMLTMMRLEGLEKHKPSSSPAASSSGRPWPASWSVSRSFSCWTSPSPPWTPTCGTL